MHVLITQSTRIGEPEINKVNEKFQDNNELIIRKNLIYERWNQITDIIQEFDFPLTGQIDNGTYMHSKPLTLLEDNKIPVPL